MAMQSAYLGNNMFHFLGQTSRVEKVTDWNRTDRSKLWLYNLHYLDCLNAAGSERLDGELSALINFWIYSNPVMDGVGWEPYPLSLRIVNLVKWFGCGVEITKQWVSSLAAQAHALSVQIEYHVQANHLFANGKGLIFAGAFIGGEFGERILNSGISIIDIELGTQFLDDGGHFELSAMYHAIVIWDLCDLVNLAERSGLSGLRRRTDKWVGRIKSGFSWLVAMSHPDGEIAFFNDAAFSIAPTLQMIRTYGESLGITFSQELINRLSLTHLSESGYAAVNFTNGKAILDVGPVGPLYQPGHAHADTLSFELSLFGQRLFVNSGTSEYGRGVERHRQRSTAAHNTVVVDGRNSSDVWAGFRVGQRARPINLNILQNPRAIRVTCGHDGYNRLRRRVTHMRQWMFQENKIEITDTILGKFKKGEAHFFLHPDVKVEVEEKNRFKIVLKTGDLIGIQFPADADVRLENSTWHPSFGEVVSNQCFVVKLSSSGLTTAVSF